MLLKFMKISEETSFNWIFVKENLILDQGMYISQFSITSQKSCISLNIFIPTIHVGYIVFGN